MTDPAMVLYIKPRCPWCIDAKRHLDERGYRYREIDVETVPGAFDDLRRVSGQGCVPTLVVSGLVLADFGTEELAAFLEHHDLRP